MNKACAHSNAITQRHIRIRGVVQGVGFRPTVWRYANALGLSGFVMNDGQGLVIECRGQEGNIEQLLHQLKTAPPAQAKVGSIEQAPSTSVLSEKDFVIADSPDRSMIQTEISADLTTCADCLQEIKDPANRRYRYPFTNCTHCGPRLSILQKLPYDRTNTSMADFQQCESCEQEYHSPADRRFHAQPNACADCGPTLALCDSNGEAISCDDIINTAADLLRAGNIIALKGIGGFQLVVDAENPEAVARLRMRKQRPDKPLALMARDIKVVEHYCAVNEKELEALSSAAGPIVVLQRHDNNNLAGVAPEQNRLGFMLPSSPLHHLLLESFATPLVMTSGNPSGEPQCIDNQQALAGLADIADYFVLHNRTILHRVDDSIVHVVGQKICLLRRARGYAPAPINVPPGFENCPPVLAMGAELKNTFCLLRGDSAVLSQHIGDLQDALTLSDYEKALALYKAMYQHQAEIIVIDQHPQYLSSQLGRQLAGPSLESQQSVSQQLIGQQSTQTDAVTLVETQHHHAHIAACLGDNLWPRTAGPVLGVALDGLGYARVGDRSELWGGDIFLADYQSAQKLAGLKPVALLGGELAMEQPWRNCFAQLHAALTWEKVASAYGDLALVQSLQKQPLNTLLAMLEKDINAPLSSSCGRLFDAAAAAMGFNPEGRISFEGQAAMAMESAIQVSDWPSQNAYPFTLKEENGLTLIDPAPMWQALLDDLANHVSQSQMAAKFHQGLIHVISKVLISLAEQHQISTVALSGGCLQNSRLLQGLTQHLQERGLSVLSHHQLPANDGGIAFGQALIAAATTMGQRFGDH